MEKFKQYLLGTAGLVIFIGFSLVVSVNVADAEQLTGCLTKSGTFKKFAFGDAPLKPCKFRQKEISIPLQALQNQIDALVSQVAGLQAQIDGIPLPDPQIAFIASLSTDFPISPATVNEPFIVIPFDNAVLNDGSAYSSPSFSAPVSGVYYFDVTVFVEEGTDARLVLAHMDAFGGDVAEYSLQAGNSSNLIRLSGGVTLHTLREKQKNTEREAYRNPLTHTH